MPIRTPSNAAPLSPLLQDCKMCDPTGVSEMMIASTVISSVASIAAEAQQASAAKQYNQTLDKNALNAYDSNTQQAQTQIVYRQQAAAQQINQENMQARSAEATAATSAGENGTTGTSVYELSRDYLGRGGQYDSDVSQQRDAAVAEIQRQMTGFGYQYQSTINQGSKPVAAPNVVGAALNIGNSILGQAKTLWPASPPSPSVAPAGDLQMTADGMAAGPV